MQDDEGEGLTKRDRCTELLDLVKNGNRAFRENRMEEVKLFVVSIYNSTYHLWSLFYFPSSSIA